VQPGKKNNLSLTGGTGERAAKEKKNKARHQAEIRLPTNDCNILDKGVGAQQMVELAVAVLGGNLVHVIRRRKGPTQGFLPRKISQN